MDYKSHKELLELEREQSLREATNKYYKKLADISDIYDNDVDSYYQEYNKTIDKSNEKRAEHDKEIWKKYIQSNHIEQDCDSPETCNNCKSPELRLYEEEELSIIGVFIAEKSTAVNEYAELTKHFLNKRLKNEELATKLRNENYSMAHTIFKNKLEKLTED